MLSFVVVVAVVVGVVVVVVVAAKATQPLSSQPFYESGTEHDGLDTPISNDTYFTGDSSTVPT